VLTTFTSYGTVPLHRQAELIRASRPATSRDILDDPDILELLAKIKRKAA
jgi:hypothetical protein